MNMKKKCSNLALERMKISVIFLDPDFYIECTCLENHHAVQDFLFLFCSVHRGNVEKRVRDSTCGMWKLSFYHNMMRVYETSNKKKD